MKSVTLKTKAADVAQYRKMKFHQRSEVVIRNHELVQRNGDTLVKAVFRKCREVTNRRIISEQISNVWRRYVTKSRFSSLRNEPKTDEGPGLEPPASATWFQGAG